MVFMLRSIYLCLFRPHHRSLSTSSGRRRVVFDDSLIHKHLFPIPVEKETLFYKIRWLLADPRKKIFPFIVLSFSRGESVEYLNHFGLDGENEGAKLLFNILHIWFIHRALCKHGMESTKVLLWEYLWSYMRGLLCAKEIEEHQFKYNLEEMQHKTLGFCLSLDESFEEYAIKNDYTLIKRILVVYFYNNDMKLIDSRNVENLAIYSILMESFINKVPEKELKYTSFTWPEFDPKTSSII